MTAPHRTVRTVSKTQIRMTRIAARLGCNAQPRYILTAGVRVACSPSYFARRATGPRGCHERASPEQASLVERNCMGARHLADRLQVLRRDAAERLRTPRRGRPCRRNANERSRGRRQRRRRRDDGHALRLGRTAHTFGLRRKRRLDRNGGHARQLRSGRVRRESRLGLPDALPRVLQQRRRRLRRQDRRRRARPRARPITPSPRAPPASAGSRSARTVIAIATTAPTTAARSRPMT